MDTALSEWKIPKHLWAPLMAHNLPVMQKEIEQEETRMQRCHHVFEDTSVPNEQTCRKCGKITQKPKCPHCGGTNIAKSSIYTTSRRHCNDCGHDWVRQL